MMIWTVMFGCDPLRKPVQNKTVTTSVRIFNTRRSAYAFREICRHHGIYADVVDHPYTASTATHH